MIDTLRLHLGEEIPLKLLHRQSRIAAFPVSLGYLKGQVVNFNLQQYSCRNQKADRR
jgi:hypothetical protein